MVTDPNAQAAAAMRLVCSLAACPDDAQLVVPSWALRALLGVATGGGRPPREASPLIPHHAKGVEAMMQPRYFSELDGKTIERTDMHERAIDLAKAIAAHCLCGHSAEQIIESLRVSPELRRLVMAVRNEQEDWSF